MQVIENWVKSRIPGLVSFQKDATEKSDFQLEGEALWLKAEAAGYSVADLKKCVMAILRKTAATSGKFFRSLWR
jgi:hypothetical protein